MWYNDLGLCNNFYRDKKKNTLTTIYIIHLGRHYFYTHISARTIIVTSLNFAKASIWKVELLSFVVDGQSIGRQDVRTDDNSHVLARQGGSHDAGSLLIPVGPKHQTKMCADNQTKHLITSEQTNLFRCNSAIASGFILICRCHQRHTPSPKEVLLRLRTSMNSWHLCKNYNINMCLCEIQSQSRKWWFCFLWKRLFINISTTLPIPKTNTHDRSFLSLIKPAVESST